MRGGEGRGIEMEGLGRKRTGWGDAEGGIREERSLVGWGVCGGESGKEGGGMGTQSEEGRRGRDELEVYGERMEAAEGRAGGRCGGGILARKSGLNAGAI